MITGAHAGKGSEPLRVDRAGHGAGHAARPLSCLRAVIVAAVALAASHAAADEAATGPATLRSRLAGADVGVALGGRLPGDYTAAELALVRDQFACLTPENCMKMQHLQPEEGRFDFTEADAFVAFAEANGQRVAGHVLVWARDECTPGWVFRDGDGPASRALVLERMQTHIRTVVGRYRGRIASWDVVNEALAGDDDNDNGDGNGGDSGAGDGNGGDGGAGADEDDTLLRPSGWEQATGTEFIEKAFACAREADPDALLLYNDYNTDLPRKRARLLRLVRHLLDHGAPIDGVGVQGHFELGGVPYERLEALCVALGGLGLKVVVSELDLAVVPRHRWWADGGAHREEMRQSDPYAAGCPDEVLRAQADEYGRLFALFDRHAGVIDRVTFWNLHDGRSWLNAFPWDHVEHPLLFDRECRAKPAFDAVTTGR